MTGPKVLGIFVLTVFAAALSERAFTENTKQPGEDQNRAEAPNYGTMGFDNTRFFSPGKGEDWVKISATGKREYLTEINPKRTALVLVDLQNGCCGWGGALESHDKKVGQAFTKRMNEVVLPNAARMIKLFRERDMIIVYLMLGTEDKFPHMIAPDKQRLSAQREFIVSKYSPGAFATSSLDKVLRENGIATIMVGGTDTSACVVCTLTGAYDRAYQTILVEDACVASREELQDAVVNLWKYLGFVRSTQQVVGDFPWEKWIDPKFKIKPEKKE